MNFVKGILILCFLFGFIDCEDSTSAETTTTTSGTITTEIPSDGLTSETNEYTNSSTETSTQDTVLTDDATSEKDNETTLEVSSTIEANSTLEANSTSTSTEPSVTITSTAVAKPSACARSLCKNNGICVEDSENPEIYSCECDKGFIGTHCQVVDECFPSENGILCLNGACVYESDGLSRSCKCFHGTFWCDEIKECREPRPPCFPNPCLNNGTCDEDQDNFQCQCPTGYEGNTCNIVNECGHSCQFGKCVTKDDLKYCECNPNFYWDETSKACEVVQSCHPNPCKNEGRCEPNTTADGFNCTCPSNYFGKTCEFQDFCAEPDGGTDVCKNGACVEANGSRKCHCNEGYYLNEESYQCEAIISPCHPNPCKNYGICIPVDSNLYNCTCSEGFTGKSCTELDHCILDGGNSLCRGASCKNDYNMGTFYCSCESGYFFDYLSRTCNKTDYCPLMNCKDNEFCEDSKCICKEHYEWNNSTQKCEPNFCISNPCPAKDLVCTEGNGMKEYECECKKGFAFDGTSCTDGSTCIFPDLNACEQMCDNVEDEYLCECLEDFNLKEDNKTCEYIGNSTCSNKTCDLGTCVVLDTTEACICPIGFIEVDGMCKDLCSAGKLPEGFCPGNQCESTSTGFRCKCEGKYKLSNDKTTCTVRKMCQRSEAGWKTCSARNAICVEEWSVDAGYRCECGNGFVENGDGTCEDVCSIEENQKICSMLGAKCDINDNGNVTCKCPPYFQPFEDNKACNKPAQLSYLWTIPLNPTVYEKALNNPLKMERQANLEYTVDSKQVKRDVQEAIEILIPGLLHINILSFLRSKNYILCKVEMQFSSITEDDLKRLSSPDLCQTSTESTSSCLIPPSLVLEKDYVKDLVTIKKTDPCDSDIKDALCESETSCISSTDDASFNCTCDSGFAVRNKLYPFGTIQSSIESCRDIDECSLNNPCPQNMKCLNTFGSYACSCRPGYRLDKDSTNEKCVELCNPSPCVHGLCSELADHDFQCRCDAGYRGAMCDLQDENFKRARTNTIVVGAVLGGALLVSLILSYAFISRLKKKKFIDDPDHMLYATEMTERRNVDSGAINNAYQRD